jgi:hypothetical protein
MPKYVVNIKRKDSEFTYEEDSLKAFKDGLEAFTDMVEKFGKPVAGASGSSKRGGGRRPPFLTNAIDELLKKEPAWLVNKFSEQIAEKLTTEYGVPGAKAESVNVVMIRKFQRGLVTRKEINGKFAYSVLKVEQ